LSLIQRMHRITVPADCLAIWGLGQMGIALQGPETVVYIDPCLSNVTEERSGDFWYRAFPAPVHPDAVSNASYVFITHEHLDHLDPITVSAIMQASPGARIITSAWCLEILVESGIAAERIITVDGDTPLQLDDIRVTAVPSAHYEPEYDAEKGYRWLGFLLEWNGVTLYHAGDTIIYPGYMERLKSLPTIDVGMVPVNGRDWYREDEEDIIGNLWPMEMARLASDLGWDVVIPGHNDLFPNNAIPFSQIVAGLENISPRQRYKILQPGELYLYVKS